MLHNLQHEFCPMESASSISSNSVFLQSSYFDLYSNFVGIPHFKAIVRLIQPSFLPLIVYEVLQNAELKINNVCLALKRTHKLRVSNVVIFSSPWLLITNERHTVCYK